MSRARRVATADPVSAAARAQSQGGRPEEALATLNAAEPWLPEHAFDRLELRAGCWLMLLALDEAEADARALLALADGGSAAQQARAWCAMAHVQIRRESAAAAGSARRALALARRARQPHWIANALLCEALACWQRDPLLGLQRAEQAAALFERAGDLRGLSATLRLQGVVRLQQADTPEHAALLRRAIDVARAAGDTAAESRAVISLYSGAPDLARRLRGLHEALALAEQGGDRLVEAAAHHNLCLIYVQLGLVRQSRRHLERSLALGGAGLSPGLAVNAWQLMASLCLRLGDRAGFEAATAQMDAAVEHAVDRLTPVLRSFVDFNVARGAAAAGDMALAAQAWRRALPHWQAPWARILLRSYLAAALRAAGLYDEALVPATEAFELLQRRVGRPTGGMDSDAYVVWQYACALRANGRLRAGERAAELAYRTLVESIAALSDEGLRRSVLHAPTSHAELVASWVDTARRRRLPRARWAAHLQGRVELGESVERLVELGTRMNALPDEPALHQFLVEELTELLGARRVLLVLDEPSGARIGGSHLPEGETAAELLTAIEPWLAQARADRSARLRHGPDGVDAIDQRSCLLAPLLAGRELLGHLYADLEGLYGRFGERDRNLLVMLAGQAAQALANARATESLEAKVAERTAQLEQRATELALINTVQNALAGQLDMPAIYEAVGEKLREVFPGRTVILRRLDQGPGLLSFPYFRHGDGTRSVVQPRPLAGFAAEVLRTRRTLVVNEQLAEARAPGLHLNDRVRGSAVAGVRAPHPGRPRQGNDRPRRSRGARVLGRRRASARDHRWQHERGAGERPPVRRGAAAA